MNYYIFLVQRKMNYICGENAFHKAYCDVREFKNLYSVMGKQQQNLCF
jgi:hypothetical protein